MNEKQDKANHSYLQYISCTFFVCPVGMQAHDANNI